MRGNHHDLFDLMMVPVINDMRNNIKHIMSGNFFFNGMEGFFDRNPSKGRIIITLLTHGKQQTV